MMNKILITGATGNIGMATIEGLYKVAEKDIFNRVYVGVRDLKKSAQAIKDMPVIPIHFDFEDPSTFDPAFTDIDILFLMRPPHLGNVSKYFEPLIDSATANGVKHVVYISVQGVENMKITPHYKIEKLIRNSSMLYTFLRPGYFMQNFITTLKNDFEAGHIFLPAGNAKFNLVHVQDIGNVAAQILASAVKHQNKAYDITGPENLSFSEMSAILSEKTGRTIAYSSPNLYQFFLKKRKEGASISFILVLIMLHYLPRFQKPPAITDNIQLLTGKPAQTFNNFAMEIKV